MPNHDNIESPITLVSFGRSGTTLVSNIFERHPQFRFVGETANLIFNPWQAAEVSAGVTPLITGDIPASIEECAGRLVRQTFLTCFPDNLPRWFQKPINVPAVFSPIIEDESRWSDSADWYWKVMRNAFPKAQYFTILRHPCDIVLSAKSYWGWGEEDIWWALGWMAHLLVHSASPVKYAIHFEKLVQDSEKTVRELFTFLDVSFYEQVLDVFSTVHLPSAGWEGPAQSLATRQDEWKQLDPTKASPACVRCITELFDRFGYSLHWPSHFDLDHAVAIQQPEKQTPSQVITELRGRIERIQQDHAVQTKELREQVFGMQAELEKARACLKDWQQRAKETREWQDKFLVLEAELEKTQACLKDWQHRAEELEVRVQQQQATLSDIYQGRIWKLACKYWAVKSKVQRLVHNTYCAIVPNQLRVALRYLRYPHERYLPASVDGQLGAHTVSPVKSPVASAKVQQPHSSMDITYLIWSIPYPPDSGGKIRTYHLLKHLAERHRVHVHMPSWRPPVIPEELKSFFASFTVHQLGYAEWQQEHTLWWAKGIPRSVASLYTTKSLIEFRELLSSQPTGLIFIDEAIVAPYAWSLTQVPCILARQKADYLFFQDVSRRMHLGKAKIGALLESLLYKSYERQLWSRFRYGVVVSEQERQLYLNLNPALNLAVIPNGVDTSFFQVEPWPASSRPTIMFHGLMSYYPNIDAAVWFVKKIFPLILKQLPQTRLMIVGQEPPREIERLARSDRIIVTGGVPDMRVYLAESHVVVVPVRIGHGTRLKILEAMAAGRPVVSTPVGAEGLTAQAGEHLLLAEEPAEFAANVVEVLTNRSLSERLAASGRQFVESSYSWECIGDKLDQYCQLVARGVT